MSRPDTLRTEAEVSPLRTRLAYWLWKHQVGWIVAAAVILVLMLKFKQADPVRTAKADTQSSVATSARTAAADGTSSAIKRLPHDVMAIVNGKDISRKDLTDACVKRHGEEVVESLVNKRLILNHCEKRGIAITNQDIAVEIDRMAKRFQLSREQWLEMLEKERGITAQEYARDIVWPTLALRRLAEKDIQVSNAEINEAMEREFGETINARLIAVGNQQLANEIRDKLIADPEQFARLAIENSVDINSASVGGLIQPIRRHVGDIGIENAAFALQEGQISEVIPVAGQFVILKCIARNQPRGVNRAEVEQQIVDKITDEKLREASHELFGKLQESATPVNIYNNPQLRQTMPGVVATVNGDRITMKELGDECLLRHGEEVLETEISRLLLEQGLKEANLALTEADLEAEVRHAAELAGVVDQQGNADLNKWFEAIVQEQKMDKDQYLRDAVWPSAALKKLTASKVQVTEEDIQKGYQANYGDRVRCRAIVLPTMRRAQEIWDKARRNPSVEYFGDLAAEYSIEPSSKALRGEVPPIQRFGGQPQLEDAAFQLQDGQLSGIIQVRDKYLILRCEGRTERIDVDANKVRDILVRDIYEKKLRLAMSEKFEAIRESSRVDNFLAGTSQAPSDHSAKGQAKVRNDSAVRQTSGTVR
ncbi:peptidylprolyl isomerase [Bythopirellula polymerisocia]|uniref:peptidylprolyl isomerase n=1 Tax=Bythopirellula polymerisocia TaxID=2528003 RepID=A0A5C6CVM3_9BACT|nr:peptidylprolyl isomerase [Bythopirellula polymerisocia]TWU28602.1 Foldase protein PrsA precursor [Bythopirellula polymerisocia]